MSLPTQHLYEFGPFRLEPAERRLLRDGQEVPLPQKAFDVLVVLVSRAGHLVPKEDLLNQVWPGTFVEEANLSYTVSLLRKALQDGSGSVRYIDTVQKLGYRFTAAVRTLATDGGHAGTIPPSVGVSSTAQDQHPQVRHSRMSRGRDRLRGSRQWAAVIAIGALLLGCRGCCSTKTSHERLHRRRTGLDLT